MIFVPYKPTKAAPVKFPKFTNKNLDFRQVVIKWAALDPSVKDGDSFYAKTILLNLPKLNKNTFYPIIQHLTVDSCVFIGSVHGCSFASKQFEEMISHDEWSVIL